MILNTFSIFKFMLSETSFIMVRNNIFLKNVISKLGLCGCSNPKNLIFIMFLSFSFACSTSKPTVITEKTPELPKENTSVRVDSVVKVIPLNKPEDYVKNEAVFIDSILKIKEYEKDFTGICIYDIDEKKYIIQHNAKRYFTPASNIKLPTFYAALKLLGDSVPALQYLENKDSLIFWGTANPTFLHPELPDSAALHFLKKTKKKIYFSAQNFSDLHFGYGWAWDDYGAYYSSEKSVFPIHANVIRFAGKGQEITVFPHFFQKYLRKDTKLKTDTWTIDRKMESNDFAYQIQNLPKEQKIDIPFRTSKELVTSFLGEQVGKKINLIERPIYANETPKTLYSFPTDTLYRLMMQESDNFLAEQILLMCAQNIPNGNRNISSRIVIDFVMKNHFADLSDTPKWVDGSGLSRYNLFTPRSFVEILLKIQAEFSTREGKNKELFQILPVGGRTGTLRNIAIYKQNEPFVFAKTGTLSNLHNLSGFLMTKSGKKLCFSFMNNHYLETNAAIRNRMAQILTDFYLYY